jgi:hypothetical protein
VIEFEGRTYYRDKASGYYKTLMRHPDRRALHRAVYSSTYGNIPHGWEVHHKDNDRENNDISNLECMPMREHLRIHRETLRANGLANMHHLRRRQEMVCEGCGKTYRGVKNKPEGENRWCSRECANRFWNANS